MYNIPYYSASSNAVKAYDFELNKIYNLANSNNSEYNKIMDKEYTAYAEYKELGLIACITENKKAKNSIYRICTVWFTEKDANYETSKGNMYWMPKLLDYSKFGTDKVKAKIESLYKQKSNSKFTTENRYYINGTARALSNTFITSNKIEKLYYLLDEKSLAELGIPADKYSNNLKNIAKENSSKDVTIEKDSKTIEEDSKTIENNNKAADEPTETISKVEDTTEPEENSKDNSIDSFSKAMDKKLDEYYIARKERENFEKAKELVYEAFNMVNKLTNSDVDNNETLLEVDEMIRVANKEDKVTSGEVNNDIVYEVVLKAIKEADRVSIPKDFYKKLPVIIKKNLFLNRDCTKYTAIVQIKFDKTSDMNLVAMAEYDESLDDVIVTVLKPFNDIVLSSDRFSFYEVKYNKWKKEHSFANSL